MTGFPRLLATTLVGIAVFVACSSDPAVTPAGGDDDDDDGGIKKVECGTATTKACGGSECKVDGDCASAKCTDTKCTTPLPASATDGKKNADETDIDCGGVNAAKCADGKTCKADDDCTNATCNATCQAPTATDGKKNGDETDIDCGGTSTKAPKCAVSKGCAAHTDCASDGCDDTKHCALSRSCTQTNGGLTCGSGEVEDANKKHESCCLALPIPGSTAKLDKYEITAGRMRTFVERTKGNVAGWYTMNKASLSTKAQASIDPFVSTLPTDLDSDGSAGPLGAKFQLGATIILADRPSLVQGCYTGNKDDQAYGAHTYFTPKADENEDRAFDQAFLDRLSLNCAPYPLIAAFCAWDGGRIQTAEENDAAYGTAIYPWGNTPEAGGFNNYPSPDSDFIPVGPGGIDPAHPYGACSNCDSSMMNWTNSYQHPEGDSGKPWDLANFISPPGRFPKDKSASGHLDLGGNMMEWTGSDGRAVGADPATDPQYGAKKRWSRSGSWEIHQANNPNWQFAVMTKYGKTGGRCARD